MLGEAFRLATSIVGVAGEGVLDTTRLVWDPGDSIEISPATMRRMLLTFDSSVQGHITEILGDDDEERVDTLVRLLKGTSEREMSALIGNLQVAMVRLDEEQWQRRRERELRRDQDRRRRSRR